MILNTEFSKALFYGCFEGFMASKLRSLAALKFRTQLTTCTKTALSPQKCAYCLPIFLSLPVHMLRIRQMLNVFTWGILFLGTDTVYCGIVTDVSKEPTVPNTHPEAGGREVIWNVEKSLPDYIQSHSIV